MTVGQYCGDPGYFGVLNASDGSTPGTRRNTSAGSSSSVASIFIQNCSPKPQAGSQGTKRSSGSTIVSLAVGAFSSWYQPP
jgi:hypothetical protein